MSRILFLAVFLTISNSGYSQNKIQLLKFHVGNLPNSRFYSSQEFDDYFYYRSGEPVLLSTKETNIKKLSCENYKDLVLSISIVDGVEFSFDFKPEIGPKDGVIKVTDLLENKKSNEDTSAYIQVKDLLFKYLTEVAEVPVQDFDSYLCAALRSSNGIDLRIKNNNKEELLLKLIDPSNHNTVEPMKKIEPRQYVTIYELENSINLYTKSNLEPIWWLEKHHDTIASIKYDQSNTTSPIEKFYPVKRHNVLDTKAKLEIRFDQEMLAKNIDFYGNISLAATLDDRPIEVGPYTVIGKEKTSYGVKNKPIKEIANNFLNLILTSREITNLFYETPIENGTQTFNKSGTLDKLYTRLRDRPSDTVLMKMFSEELDLKRAIIEDVWERFINSNIPSEYIDSIVTETDSILESIIGDSSLMAANMKEWTNFKIKGEYTKVAKLDSMFDVLLANGVNVRALKRSLREVNKKYFFNERKKWFGVYRSMDDLYDYLYSGNEEYLKTYEIKNFLTSFDNYFKNAFNSLEENSGYARLEPKMALNFYDDFLSLKKQLESIEKYNEKFNDLNWKDQLKSDYNPILNNQRITYSKYLNKVSLCLDYINYFIRSGPESMDAFLGLSNVSKIEFEDIYKNIESSFNNIRNQNSSDERTFYDNLLRAQAINSSVRRLSNIAINMLDLELTEYVRAELNENPFKSNNEGNSDRFFGNENETIGKITNLLDKNPEARYKFERNISLRAGNRLFNKMLFATIDLAEAGAKNGEVLEIKVLWYNIGTSAVLDNTIGEIETSNGSVELSTAKFIVKKTGWGLEVTESAMLINRLRERAVTNNVSPSNFKPTAGASLLWTYHNDYRFEYRKKRNTKKKEGNNQLKKIWKWFEPSFGVNVSYLDFDTEKTFEVGLGPIVGLWNNRLFFNAGYNLSVKGQSPFYFGVGFSFSNIFDNVKGNIDGIER